MAVKATLVLTLLPLSRALNLNARPAGQARTNSTVSKVSASCECKSWADVYYSGKAYCGRGNELFFLSKWGFSAAYAATEPITGLPHKVCYDFFKNFLTPSCVNVDLHSTGKSPRDAKGKQWCYVSNDCDALNGGDYATNQIGFAQGAWHQLDSTNILAWKYCEPQVDPMLKDWDIQTVLDQGEASDVSLSRLLRLAYPAVNISWADAKIFVCAVNDAYAPGLTLAQMVDSVAVASSTWGAEVVDMQERLTDIMKSEQATVLDVAGHGDNFHVLRGREVWEVLRIPNGNMAYLGGHFFDEFKVTCKMGCAQPESRNAVDLDTV